MLMIPVAGPIASGWAEGTLTRAKELEALAVLALENDPVPNCGALATSLAQHIAAARQAAEKAQTGRIRLLGAFGVGDGPLLERAMSNLDAAETQLLNFAPAPYLVGQVPSLLNHVRRHLVPTDPRRQAFERIARKLGVVDPQHPLVPPEAEPDYGARLAAVTQERGTIVTAMRAASSAALREHLQVRSFRFVIAATTLAMLVLAISLAITGIFWPKLIPLCFAPEEAGQARVVCPAGQSERFSTTPQTATSVPSASPAPTASAVPTAQASAADEDIDYYISKTVTPMDLTVVLLLGLTAAALAATVAIRGIKGSSERHGLPVAMALLKLPTGAITAFLGLLLMRGQFVPGLSALDRPDQILAWAVIFGYAQQLFTRLVDRQGQVVLDSVRGADKAPPAAGQP
jgi:hypothetical protein